MSSNLTLGHVAGFGTALLALGSLPDENDLLNRIPPHYLSGRYAHTVFPRNQHDIESADQGPTGSFDVLWPVRKLWGNTVSIISDMVERPFVTAFYWAEKAMRGDFDSSVLMAEKNLEALKEQNIVYEREIQKLAPIADLIMHILKAAEHESEELALSNLELAEGVQLKEKQIEEITEVLRTINVEAAMEALEKITTAAQKALTNPSFIEDLEISRERLENVERQLDEAQATLQQTEKLLNEKIALSKELMEEAERLSLQKEQIFKEIELKAATLVENTQSTNSPVHPEVTHGSFSQLAY